MKRFIEIEIVHAGQPRPYADEVYEAYLTFTVPEGQIWAAHPGEEWVKKHIGPLVHPFTPDPRQWHEPFLKTLERVDDNRWHVVVIQPYLD